MITLPEQFESDRLLFQRLRYEDAEEIFYAYASKSEATKYVSWPTHSSVKDTRDFIRYARDAWNKKQDFTFSLRLKATQHLIGSYGVINELGRLQFGYILSPLYWKQGLATEACKTVTSLLSSLPGVFRIGTFVDCEHQPSCRVLEKAGFEREGRLKNWIRFPNQGNLAKDCWVYVLP
jgi:[ribosomal protein S5]-alanine N-acetyltransferase